MNEFTKRVAEGGTGTRNVNGTRSRFTCAETCTQEFPKNFLQRVPDGVPVASVTERHPVECSRANVLCLDGLMTRWTTDKRSEQESQPRLKRALLYHLSYAPTCDNKEFSTPAVPHYVPCTQRFPKNGNENDSYDGTTRLSDGAVARLPLTIASGSELRNRRRSDTGATESDQTETLQGIQGSSAVHSEHPEQPGSLMKGTLFGLLFSLPLWALAAWEWYSGVIK